MNFDKHSAWPARWGAQQVFGAAQYHLFVAFNVNFENIDPLSRENSVQGDDFDSRSVILGPRNKACFRGPVT
jgi:hypothetical protein